jgi:hypothetical protein
MGSGQISIIVLGLAVVCLDSMPEVLSTEELAEESGADIELVEAGDRAAEELSSTDESDD